LQQQEDYEVHPHSFRFGFDRFRLLFHPAGAFVVFTNVFDGFKADLFQNICVNVGQLLHIDAGLAHFEFSQFR
jgi:hypothetical protein